MARALARAWRTTAPAQTGLLRLTWDNGDRTVLVNPELGGVTLGWSLTHTAQDELFAAIEGTAFHTRVILERMEEHGVPVRRDHQRRRHSAEERGAQPGLRQRDGQADPGARGRCHQPRVRRSSRFWRRAPSKTIEEAQDALCPGYRDQSSRSPRAPVLIASCIALYRKLYFAFGRAKSARCRDRRRAAGAAPHRGPGPRRKRVLEALRAEVLEANLELVRRGLVIYTFGNASGVSRERRAWCVIKPSGVPTRR